MPEAHDMNPHPETPAPVAPPASEGVTNGPVSALLMALVIAFTAIMANRFFWIMRFVEPVLLGSSTIRLRLLHLVPVVLGIAVLTLVPAVFVAMRKRPWWWVPWAVLAFDCVSLAVAATKTGHAGVVFHFALPELASAGALATGIAFAYHDRRVIDWAALLAVWAQAIMGAFQMMQRQGIDTAPGRFIEEWDLEMAKVFKAQFAMGRAEGFDVNPNSYSFLGVVVLTWALFGMKNGPMRWAGVTGSLIVIALGQSRTAALVVIALLAFAVFDALRRNSKGAVLRWVIVGAAGLLVVGALTYVTIGPRAMQSLTSRFTTGAATVTQGTGADKNLDARTQVWGRAWEVFLEKPLGAWEAPGRVLGGAPDNDFIHRLVLAGPLGVFVAIALLVWLWVCLRPPAAPSFGPAFAIALGLSSMTAVATQALAYLIMGWFVVGAAVGLREVDG